MLRQTAFSDIHDLATLLVDGHVTPSEIGDFYLEAIARSTSLGRTSPVTSIVDHALRAFTLADIEREVGVAIPPLHAIPFVSGGQDTPLEQAAQAAGAVALASCRDLAQTPLAPVPACAVAVAVAGGLASFGVLPNDFTAVATGAVTGGGLATRSVRDLLLVMSHCGRLSAANGHSRTISVIVDGRAGDIGLIPLILSMSGWSTGSNGIIRIHDQIPEDDGLTIAIPSFIAPDGTLRDLYVTAPMSHARQAFAVASRLEREFGFTSGLANSTVTPQRQPQSHVALS